jgi:hypothetical protein
MFVNSVMGVRVHTGAQHSAGIEQTLHQTSATAKSLRFKRKASL